MSVLECSAGVRTEDSRVLSSGLCGDSSNCRCVVWLLLVTDPKIGLEV